MALLASDPLDARLDEDGDLYIGPSGVELIGGLEGVAQLARTALRLFKGEWFLDLDAGMPWYQELLAAKSNQSLLRQRATETLLAVPGVVDVVNVSVETDSSTREARLSADLRTAFGDTRVEV